MSEIKLDVDVDANACYIRLSEDDIAATEEFDQAGSILVDLDSNREVVGIEILGTGTKIPLTDLEHRYHIRQERSAVLNMLLPSIEQAWVVRSAPDSVMTLRKVESLAPTC